MENKSNILMGRYEVGRLLGQGTFARVYYARGIQTNQSVAIKVVDKEKILKVGLIEQIKREISVMRLVRHPNVVHLYEVMATKTKIYFVMEYAKGGELFHKISKGKLKEDMAQKYFQQLINVVDFCHSRGVYHRDIKPENLLLDESGNLKVSDFGLSALAESRRQDGLLHTTCGTPAYVAPEVINRKGYDGAMADIWSCGVVLFVLLAGYLPFQDSNLMEMYRKIGKADYKCPTWFPPEPRRLLRKILNPNPEARISIEKIKENSWFKRGLSSPPECIKTEKESKDEGPKSDTTNTANGSGPSGSCEQVVTKPPNLNAFDIISLSSGFNLSGLFGDMHKKEARFTSKRPASFIISKLEEMAKHLGLRVQKKEPGLMKLDGVKKGRNGVLSIDAEIFEITPYLHLVEMKKSNGDTMEYERKLEEEIRPALTDIIWVWQGQEQLPEQALLHGQ